MQQAQEHPGRSSVLLSAQKLTLGYDQRTVAEELDIEIPPGEFTVIVGPNACGKSTTLKALARIIKPSQGTVLLDGSNIHSMQAKEVARTIGLLPQSATAPEAMTVEDLVGRGRFPYQKFLRQWSEEDQEAVEEAMRLTGVEELAGRAVDELSGGQKQRAWIAMVVAQQTQMLLLDEPTTFLDISHQLDVLDLCSQMQESGLTLVAVLHDLNQACRYATNLVCMKDGKIIAQGAPSEILTAELVKDVFAIDCDVMQDPRTGTPMIIPASTAERRKNICHSARAQ